MLKWWLIGSIAVLLGMGLITLHSITPQLVPLQILFIGLAGIAFWVLQQQRYMFINRFRWVGYSGLVLLLLTTLVLGNVTRGSARWIPLGPVNLQPSQFALAIVGLVLSYRLAHLDHRNIAIIFRTAIIAVIPALLIVIEPDLGTTILLVLGLAVGMFTSSIPWRYIIFAVLGVVLVVGLGWSTILQPYQKARITSFIASDVSETDNYNAEQALIAAGSGSITGRGIGKGTQSQLAFLPEKHTDFIFAALAEEQGFLGSSLVLISFASVIASSYLIISKQSPEQHFFGIIILAGFTAQVIVNMGMNIGLLPITGLTLPFISYGGSSMVGWGITFGLLTAQGNQPQDQKQGATIHIR